MKKSKKIIVLVMACVMLFGATLTVQASSCDWLRISPSEFCGDCNHSCEFYVCIGTTHQHYKCEHNHIY